MRRDPQTGKARSWASEVIDRLALCKRAGLTFEHAWEETIMRYPPRGREFGRGQMEIETPEAIAEALEWGEPFDEFLRRVCEQAWMGEKGVLRHMTADLTGGFASEDQSGFAVKNGRMTNRAAA